MGRKGFKNEDLYVKNRYGKRELFRIDVFKDFARSKSEFIRKIRRSKKVIAYIKAINGDISKLSKAKIEVDKGREGNWNNYIREFENIQPKRGENWYEYQLYVNTIPKKRR